MENKLITFKIPADQTSIGGWAPWRLAIDFPRPIEKNLILGLKLPAEFYELDSSLTPFNHIEISSSFLKRIQTSYPILQEDGIDYLDDTISFFRDFLADLRNGFWFQFGKDDAFKKFSKLKKLIIASRAEGIDVEYLLVCTGLILWEQLYRKKIFDLPAKLKENDLKFFENFSGLEKRPVLSRTNIHLKNDYLATKALLETIEHFKKPAYGHFFHFVTHRLVTRIRRHNCEIDEVCKKIAEFYACFGVPAKSCKNHHDLIKKSFTEYEYYQDGLRKLILKFYYKVFMYSGFLSNDDIVEMRDRIQGRKKRVYGGGLIQERKSNEREEVSQQDNTKNDRFPLPAGLSWTDVTMTFVLNDTIKVEAGDIIRNYSYDQIDFEDKRTKDDKKPNKSWLFLKILAREHGEIHLRSELDTKEYDKLRQTVRDLRKRLKAFINIDDDPFCPYGKFNAYVTKFILIDNTGADAEIPETSKYYTLEDYKSEGKIPAQYRRNDISVDKSYEDDYD